MKTMKTAKPSNPFLKTIISLIVIVVIVLAYAAMTYLSSPKVSANTSQIDLPDNTFTPSKIAWPPYGQAAVGVDGYGVLGTNGQQTAHPIASIAKLVLAMSVIDKYPLGIGQTGPDITITQADADLYAANLAKSGSLVPVNVGEQLTEYQMLQALLIASGDNIADTLANWAFGSADDYAKYANQMLSDLNLKTTHIADPSGLSAETVSSAHDLVLLGEKVLDEPIIADIVSQKSVTLPIAGTLANYDSILGQNGVIGIKTGNTDEAGGCFLFAATNTSDAKAPTIVGAILGAKNLSSVLNDSKTFIQANINNFVAVPVFTSGQVIGTYNSSWGQKVNAAAAKDLTIMTVKGEKITTNVTLSSINKSTASGTQVGTVTITTAENTVTVPSVLDAQLTGPSFLWKFLHPWKR